MDQCRVSRHPLVARFLTRLRDRNSDAEEFRAALHALSALLACEACADLPLREVPVTTPLREARGKDLSVRVGLVPVLRAGLGMVEGALGFLPDAEVRHLGLRRDEETLQPLEYYNRLPDRCTVDVCLVLDPMLATGGSAAAALDVLKRWGVRDIRFVGILATPEGLAVMRDRHPDVPLFVAAVDEGLDGRGFIVPGLGDAGDRQFGTL